MIHKRLKVLILSAAFLGLPAVRAFDWKATGDFVGSDGFAYTTGNVYAEGDRLISTAPVEPPSGGGTDGGGGSSETTTMRKFRQPKTNLFSSGTPGKKFTKIAKYITRAGSETGAPTDTPQVITAGNNTQFEATATDGILNIYGTLNGIANADACPLKVDGDITLKAVQADMTVNVKSPVTFVPYIDPTGDAQGAGGNFTGTGYAQIYFDVAEGKKIEFNVDHNLEFKGRTLAAESAMGKASATHAFEPMDLFVSFKGAGQVLFKMADGTAIKFSGDIDDTYKVDMLHQKAKHYSIDGLANNAAGAKVLICMDQSKQEIANGLNKVTFMRKNFAEESQRTMVYVGPNSGIFYVSNDVSGKAAVANPTLGGYGSINFDVSNKGTGRSVLFLRGARTFGWDVTDSHGNPLYAESDPEFYKVANRFLFNDAAFVVAGHKVDGYTPAELRTTLNYSIPAGSQAVFKVSDELAYSHATAPYAPTAADRRGLLVINDTETIAKLGSDNYWDFFNVDTPGGGEGGSGEVATMGMRGHTGAMRKAVSKSMRRKSTMGIRGEEHGAVVNHGHDWAYSAGISDQVNLRNVRTGFVVGVNGKIDVYHNTFLDYVAGTGNRVDDVAISDYRDYKGGFHRSRAVVAEHNPSGLVFDGLDAKLYETALSAFEAADPALGADAIRAQVVLRGNGAVYLRSSASASLGYIEKFWQLAAPGQMGMKALRKAFARKGMSKKVLNQIEHMRSRSETTGASVINPIDIPTLDWDLLLTNGESKFDGYRLQQIEEVTSEAGFNVLEVQGPVAVHTAASDTVADLGKLGSMRKYDSSVANQGSIRMLSTVIDHTGKDVAERPLIRNRTYSCYNSPVAYLNDTLEIGRGATFVHDDTTKLVNGVPSASTPAIRGGERMFFSDQLFTFDGKHTSMRYRFPELRLSSGTLALKESLNLAGVRVVVTDVPGLKEASSNQSRVVFYDHGGAVDSDITGYGRLLMLGSLKNTASNGVSNWVSESGYLNVFKQNGAPTASSSVVLGLSVGNQFPSYIDPHNYEGDRGLHLILTSSVVKGGTNVAVGWPTTKGDLSGSSFPYASTRYGNSLLAESLPADTALLFEADSLKTSPSTISIDKGFIGFGSFDKNGKGARVPVSVTDAQGVAYINHNGKITVGDAAIILDTMLVQKVWNDYDFAGARRLSQYTGIIDLPHDQSSFTENGGVQAYGITKEMFKYRTGKPDEEQDGTDGWVRLSVNNPERPNRADQSGAQEVVINWANRQGLSDLAASPVNPVRSLAMGAKRPTRAVTLSSGVDSPVAKPAKLLYVGSGDDIRQLRVAGATPGNRLEIEVSGDDATRSYGRVREFATEPSTNDLNTEYRVGEGANAIIYGVLGGRFGLGTTNWNAHSINPWNILGRNFVQVGVEGDCVVDVNSDLIIGDAQPLVAVDSFGDGAVHRITFVSETERTIRIPAGMEWDLSSFGHGSKRQEIAFGGKVKLVVESGARIRGPRSVNGGVVLYFNDQSEFVFESPSGSTKLYKGFEEFERCRLMGKMQIWLNKSAAMNVNDGVIVGVESDESTPQTNIVISLNRQSKFNIGSAALAGGAFQVGNTTPVDKGSVKFNLVSRHVDSTIHLDRQGFLGLGVGVLEKQSNMNGTASAAKNPELTGGKATVGSSGAPAFNESKDAWMVKPLFDIENLGIEMVAGRFEHNNIVDGSDPNAALIAVGPAKNYSFKMSAPGLVVIKGGGNVMSVPSTAKDGLFVNVWDYAGQFPQGPRYSILASAAMLAQREDVASRVPYNSSGFAYSFTKLDDMFNLLAMAPYDSQKTKFVAAGRSVNAPMSIAFVNVDTSNSKYPADAQIIVRNDVNAISGGQFSQALDVGVAAGIETDAVGPTSFGVPS